MTDITIPPEALEAAAEDIYNHWQFSFTGKVPWVPGGNSLMQEKARDLARAAIAAAINAWPGAFHNGHWLLFPHTKIPLPTENSNVEV
jgi:hypothetical protein